jgi:hypothetical protein
MSEGVSHLAGLKECSFFKNRFPIVEMHKVIQLFSKKYIIESQEFFPANGAAALAIKPERKGTHSHSGSRETRSDATTLLSAE